MKEILTWVKQLLGLSSKDRSLLKKEVLSGISEFSDEGEGSKNREAGGMLKEELLKNYDFIGFAPNITYIKEKGNKEDLEALWVHPFATPALLFAHKKYPVLVISSGGIRFNDSVLNEIKSNLDKYFLNGISG